MLLFFKIWWIGSDLFLCVFFLCNIGEIIMVTLCCALLAVLRPHGKVSVLLVQSLSIPVCVRMAFYCCLILVSILISGFRFLQESLEHLQCSRWWPTRWWIQSDGIWEVCVWMWMCLFEWMYAARVCSWCVIEEANQDCVTQIPLYPEASSPHSCPPIWNNQTS